MGKLFVVSTPIGNLKDITLRAIEVLKSCDFIACEDTRRTKLLTDEYGIDKKLVSYHQHSKLTKIDYILGEIKLGKNVALVSDAGTPAISDPGAILVEKAYENNIEVEVIPGVSAITALYSVAGFSETGFVFLGFLPKKKGRQTLFKEMKNNYLIGKKKLPIIIYESFARILKTLEEFSEIGDFQVVLGRELTKKFEEVRRGKIEDIIRLIKNGSIKIKGEFVVCLRRE